MKLTTNQMQFVADALSAGLEVKSYSGRYMFGRTCPAVHLDNCYQFRTSAVVCTDNLGLGYVVYAMD